MPPEVDFSFYGLAGNPFLKELQRLPMVDRDENLDEIKSILGEFVGSDSAGIMVLWGDYGMGKSFTLRKLVDYLKEGDWTGTGKKVFPIFIKSIEPEEKGKYLPNLFARIMAFIGKRGIEKLVKEADKPTAKQFSLFRIMNKAADGDETAMDWLLGRSLTAGELRKLGVRYRPSEYSEIRNIFFELFGVLKASGYDSIVLLIDEWEFLMSVVSRTRLWAIVREIQRIYDAFGEEEEPWRTSHATVVFVLASSAGAWFRFLQVAKEIASKQGGASTETFLRRIADKGKVELSPLGKEHIGELMITRMDPFRLEPSNHGSLTPFSDDYLLLMERVTYGIPSRVLRYGALILSEGAKEKMPKIGSEFAEKVLRDYGLWEEMKTVQVGKH